MIKSTICFALFVLFTSSHYTQVYWERTAGPSGGRMRSIVKGPGDKVISGTEDGRIYYSDDNGMNWRKADTVFGINVVDFVYCGDGSILAATVGSKGVHRSFDGGKTWPFSRLVDEEVWALEKDPLGYIYAGTRTNGHIWKSTNNGYNWTLSQSTALPEFREVSDIKYNSVTNTFFAAYSRYIFRSTDNGETWELLTNGIGEADVIWSLTVDKYGNVYGGSDEQGGAIYLSKNNGDSWVNMDTSQTFGDVINVSLYDMLAIEDYLLVATRAGVAKSTDMGQSWVFITEGLTYPFVVDFSYDTTSNTIYAANQFGGIFTSTDYGESWNKRSNGINTTWVLQISFDKNETLYAAAVRNGIYKSTDSGETWEMKVNGITNFTHQSVTATKGGYVITGTQDGYFVSSNGGEDWQRGNGFETNTIFRIEEDLKGNWYFARWGTGFMRSTDKGSIWTTAIPEFVFSIAVDSLGNIFAGTNSGRIYKSTDNGESWFFSDNGLHTGSTIMDIVVSPSGNSIFAGLYDHGIYKSEDNGESWQDVSYGGLEQRAIYTIGVRNDREIFAALYGGTGIFYSQEGGGNWLQVNQGMYDIIVWDMEIDKDGYVYAATNESVWRTKTNKVITGIEDEIVVKLPEAFYLYQNYPNPFNPVTTIKYEIPGQARNYNLIVELKLYDILGNVVATLVSEEQPAGSYEVEFDGSNLASGIYIYRLRFGSFTASKKIILIK